MRIWKLDKKEFVFLLLVVMAILIMIIQPVAGLTKTGHSVLGVTIITIAGWMLRPWNVPCSICGIFLMGAVLLFDIPSEVAFSGFTQGALWTLIPALFFGFVLQKTGLGKRIAMKIFRLFPVTWFSMLLAWTVIGITLSLVTPSMTVRVAIMLPIALECCKMYRLEKGTVEASLILIFSIIMAILPGCGWLTGGLMGPIILGVYETVPELTGVITFQSWMQCSLLPVIATTVFSIVFVYVFLKPKGKLNASKNEMENKPVSMKEIITGIILGICCVLFFTGKYHGISNTTICLFALAALFLTKCLEPKDFIHGISWDLIVFIGSALSMSQIFMNAGISQYLSDLISPLFTTMAAKPVVFVFALLIFLFIWRFIDVTPLLPTMVILAPVIPTVAQNAGIHPMVWSSIFCLATCSMFLSYTNMWTSMGRQIVAGYQWKESHLFRAGMAFFLASILGVIVSIPYWNYLELL